VANGPSKTLGLAKFCRISRVLQSRFLAVMCISESRFFCEAVLESRFFARLRVSKSQFVPLSVFINDFFWLHFICNVHEATYKFPEKKLILTYRNVHFGARKTAIFSLGYHNVVCYNRISSSSQFQEAGLRLYKLIVALN